MGCLLEGTERLPGGGYAAHRELNYSKPVPFFETAEEVAYYYDTWIRDIIEPDIFEELPIQESVSWTKSAQHYSVVFTKII